MKTKILANKISNFPILKVKKFNYLLDPKLGESPFFLSIDTVLNMVSPSEKEHIFYNKYFLSLLISTGVSLSQLKETLEKIHSFSFVEKKGYTSPTFSTPTIPNIYKSFDKHSQFQEKSNKAMLIALSIYLEITRTELNEQRKIYANCSQDSISTIQTMMQINIAFIHLFLDDIKYFMDFSGKPSSKSDMQTDLDKLLNDPFLKEKVLDSLNLLIELKNIQEDSIISEAADMALKFIRPEIIFQYYKDLE